MRIGVVLACLFFAVSVPAYAVLQNEEADINRDGRVNLLDLSMLALEWTHTNGITSYLKAHNPQPLNHATEVDRYTILSWTPAYGYKSHNLYFGTEPLPGPQQFQGSQFGSSFNPGELGGNTTFYWRVDGIVQDAIIPGDIWSFTTAPCTGPGAAENLQPGNGVIGVSIYQNIRWTAGTDAASHDVYFGTAPDLVNAFQRNQAETVFDPGILDPNTTYYWRIDEKNLCGTTPGTVWSFETGGSGTVMNWDAATGWSNENNPNGPWAYCDDTGAVMPYQTATIGEGPAGWANSPSAPPSLFRPEQDWYDIPAGRIGGHGPWRITWTSPVDGQIVISGGIWQLFEPTRVMNWALLLNGAVLTGEDISVPDASSSQPFDFASGTGGVDALTCEVQAGDVITLRVWSAGANTFVGIDFSIEAFVEGGNGAAYNLSGDWSDIDNPNSPWGYGGRVSGQFDLLDVHQSQWLPGDLGPNQGAWADTAGGIPGWFKSTGNGLWDIPAGITACHSPVVLRWLTPQTGHVSIAGGLWLARNLGRNQNWELRFNSVLLSSGLLQWGPNSSGPLDFATGSGGTSALTQIAQTGDIIELHIYPTSTGDFVGVDMEMTYTP